MHGYGSHEKDLMSLAPFLPPDLLIASLRAPLIAPEPIENGFAWFTLGEPANPQADEADAAAISVLNWLDRLEKTSGKAPKIGLLGFSQGGAMALQLMRHAPERFASAVVLSGFVVNGNSAGDRVLSSLRPPVFWGRDVDDPIIPPRAIERTASWLPEHSELQSRLYPGIQHGISEQELNDVSLFLRTTLLAPT